MSVPPDIEVLNADNARVSINAPLDPGRATAAASRPVVLSTEDKTALDAVASQLTAAAILAKIIAAPATEAKQDAAIVQETATATVLGVAADAASATTTIKAALRGIATALGVTALDLGSGTAGSRTLRFFQDTAQWIGGAGAVSSAVQRTTLASDDPAVAVLGTTSGAAVTTSVAGTIQGYLRGIVSLLVSGITVATHAVTQSGTWTVQPGNTANTTAWKVDNSAVTQPTSVADGSNVVQGAVADAVVAAGAAGSISAKLRAISRDIVANVVLAAGTNAIGKLAANSGVIIGAVENNSAATAGGLASTSRLLSAAATTNATSVKGSSGRLYKMQGYNAATSVRYLKLYNKASAPTVGSDTPVRTIAIPPGAGFDLDWSNLGYYFSAGIAYAITTGSADADTGALTAGDILGLNMDYA